MPKHTVPSIDLDFFAFGDILELFKGNKIYINTNYQRGDIWKAKQKIELIQSINLGYSIGVLVLFVNEDGRHEILDGQQRLLSIKAYLAGADEFKNSDLTPYQELDSRAKKLIDAYCIYYLKLRGHDPESREEDIVQTFLRLQEGTPLNKAEKLNAYRGEFKNLFTETAETHPLFKYLGNDKRFRLRQLAAELLLLELECDFENMIFPSLDLNTMIGAVKKYEKKISRKKIQFFKGNLDYMEKSLNMLLGAFQLRDVLSFYLLISYLRQHKAGKENLHNKYAVFARTFLQKLNSFSIYDTKADSLTKKEFETYKRYKEQSKVMTTSESFRSRLDIMIKEFNRLYPIIIVDKERLFSEDQKRILFYRQQAICLECSRPLEFKSASAHHEIAYSAGGKTSDLNNATLVHSKCHEKIEKRLKKQKEKKQLPLL